MPRTSEAMGALAAALAKAQAELVNPEKSLTATIQADRHGGIARSFRYAPLSSGLEIVRKTLGRYEIATIQTTAIDVTTGIVSLTTMLAHASGEWVASVWPVCTLADFATPKRSGAALTYARRYALFTLVGIAGEDDLDAPDLGDDPMSSGIPGAQPIRYSQHSSRGNGSARKPTSRVKTGDRAVLAPERSAALRRDLLVEIERLASIDAATTWARNILRAKNTMMPDDALAVEAAFANRLASLGERNDAQRSADVASCLVSPINKPTRYRSKEHLRFVSGQPCLVCGRQPCDAHHLRFAQSRAVGRKVSDEFTVPLCRVHHRELHRSGNERKWWTDRMIDPLAVARDM